MRGVGWSVGNRVGLADAAGDLAKGRRDLSGVVRAKVFTTARLRQISEKGRIRVPRAWVDERNRVDDRVGRLRLTNGLVPRRSARVVVGRNAWFFRKRFYDRVFDESKQPKVNDLFQREHRAHHAVLELAGIVTVTVAPR